MPLDSLYTIIIFSVWGGVLIFLIYLYLKRRPRKKVPEPPVQTSDMKSSQNDLTSSYLSEILNNLDIIIFSIDDRGVFTLSEGSGLKNIGLEKDQIVGQSVFEVYKDNKEILTNIRLALNGETFTAVVRNSGRVFQTHYKPIFSNNKVSGVIGVAFDITEQRKAKDHLYHYEERFQVLAENIPGVIYLCRNDEQYSSIYINEHIKELTGYSKNDLEQGKVTLAELIHPDYRKKVIDNVNKMLEERKPFEVTYKIKQKKGGWKWVREIGVGIFRNDEPVMLEGFITDISEKIMIEHALRESEEKLRKIVDKSNDAIYVIQGKQFVMINEKFLDLFGYTSEEVMVPDFTFENLLDEGSIALIEDRRQKRERGEEVSDRISFVGKTKENNKIHLEASIANIEWEGSPAVLGILRDVTSQKHLEEQLRHSQKIEAVGRLAGGLAHDFNNILTAISGYADMIDRKVEDGPIKGNVKEIITSADRATKLIQQLLAFSRRQVIKPVPVNINAIIEAMDALLYRVVGENVKYETFFEDDIGTIEIDPALLEQIIMNLVINARDAMPDGGTLTIETFNTELSSDYMETYPDVAPGKYVVLAISDTGIGIAPEIRDKIYEPFFTTKEKGKGTGLGLSTVYGIVKQSGGHVVCYSEVKNGTIFKIYFKRVEKEVVTVPVQKPVSDGEYPRAKNETVLIVEDEGSVRRFCNNVLTDLGYTVIEAKDGKEALKISQNQLQNIDLLITDIMMPGINGKELADKLCNKKENLEVIFISGYTNDVIVNRGILEPDITFIQKPFSAKTLSVHVREVLDGEKTGSGDVDG